MAHSGEAGLLAKARAGDRDAKHELFWTRYDSLRAYVAAKVPRWLRARVDAEDVLQDVFAIAFRNVDRFEPRGEGSVDRWLRTIAVRRLINIIREQKRLRRGGENGATRVSIDTSAQDQYRPILELLAGANRSPSSEVAAEEATVAVRAAIEDLAPNHRDAIRFRYIDGLSLNEVASKMGTTRGGVSMVVSRAIKRLKQNLGNLSQYMDR